MSIVADRRAAPSSAPDRDGAVPARFYLLDLLRLTAALMVAVFHFVGLPGVWAADGPSPFGSGVRAAAQYGWMGVEFFFVISGFVICMSCWGRRLSEFAASRVARLFPAYWFAVAASALALMVWPAPGKELSTADILVNLTMFQSFLGFQHVDGVYWTLAIELVFYLLFAVVVAAGLTLRRVVLFCLVWAGGSLAVYAFPTPFLINTFEPRFTAYFVMGIALFLIHLDRRSPLPWITLVLGYAAAVASLSGRVSREREILSSDAVRFVPALVLMTAFVLVMLAVALGWTSWIRWRGLIAIGALTYPFYLLHHAFGLMAIRHGNGAVSPGLLVVLVVGALLASAWLVHRWVERPTARRLRRGVLRLLRRREPASASA